MSKEKAHWSYPNPVYIAGKQYTGGLVWWGEQPATEADIRAVQLLMESMYDVPADEVAIDKLSIVGRLDRNWNTMSSAALGDQDPNGGEGSNTYEHQNVGSGVDFAKEPIWHYDEKGVYVKEIPGMAGEHHSKPDGTNAVGPEPGSEAEKLLGDGTYAWDELNAWYVIC